MIALTSTSIAWLLFTVILGGWVVYALLNIRQARDELGSEIELAANRKKYYDDETLEGPRLTRVLGIGVILMVVTVIMLPLYWILEPSRQVRCPSDDGVAFAREVTHDYFTGGDSHPARERNIVAPGAEAGDGVDDVQPRTDRASSLILVRLRPTEVRENPVAEVLRDMAAMELHDVANS